MKRRKQPQQPPRIPFNRSSVVGDELRYVERAFESGRLAGDGGFTKACHTLLEGILGVSKAFLTTSCTHALEMSALLLDIQPGDEVVLPSFTFVSTVNAFVLRGAKPVFCDIRPDTLNLDERVLPSLLTKDTRAIVVVHYAGIAAEMDGILEIARTAGIPVVEDNAHGLFGRYRGRYLGTMGAMGTQSFHGTKNISCGEGGALLLNDDSLVERASIVREKGTNRAAFFRGEVDKYSWVDVGSSYLPSEILAAVLLAQLEAREEIQARRKSIWERYHTELAGWAAQFGVRSPVVPEYCEQAYHLYYLLLPSLEVRSALIEALRAQGILAVFHYLPLHLSPMGRRFGGKLGDCPVTEDVSERLLRLPLFHSLTESEQSQVIEVITAFSW